MPAGGERPWRRHAAFSCVAAAYLFVFPYFAKLNNPNENVRVWMTAAIVQHGTLSIDPVERRWGEVSDRAAFEGRRYSSKAPGTSFLGVPVLFAHAQVARLFGVSPSPRAVTFGLRIFTVALPLLAFMLVFARRVERETGSPWARDLLVVGLGMGTMMYTYALGFVGHAQSAALAFGSYLLLLDARADHRRPLRLCAAGALAGLAVVFEYQSLFVAGALAAFALHEQRRRALWFALGALGPAILLGAYHAAAFGAPWAFPYGYVDDPGYKEFHTGGFFGFDWPRARVVKEVLVSMDYGLFVFSPFLALGLGGALWVSVRGRRPEAIVAAAAAILMVVFVTGMTNWRGGWCAAGPRYLAAAVPFFAWGIALSWKSLWARWPPLSALLAGLVGVSVVLCTVASATFPHYPLQFDNPVFDVSVRLLREGYAPYGLGWALGLPGTWGHLPVALALVAALALALRAPRPRLVAVAAVLAVTLLALASLPGRRRSSEEERTFSFVRGVWEPRGGTVGAP